MKFLSKWAICPAFLFLPACYAASSQPSSVAQQSYYNEQRACVKACIWGFPPTGDLSILLGCPPPWINACFCRADAPQRAASALTKCITSACTDINKPTMDLSSALSVYTAYCAGAAEPVSNNAQPTSDPRDGAVVTIVSVITATAESSGQTRECTSLFYRVLLFVVIEAFIYCLVSILSVVKLSPTNTSSRLDYINHNDHPNVPGFYSSSHYLRRINNNRTRSRK